MKTKKSRLSLQQNVISQLQQNIKNQIIGGQSGSACDCPPPDETFETTCAYSGRGLGCPK
ncbi:hypothetical protein H2O64_11005 [Kordia sp. YSTF-M3]|uniref:Bacteriocin n=1 Tax=Kordia aestuariivivens TaxID=2759037 RepID=A0ABR7Q9F9_9FLAO|nr:hypothetical protein [Kordia aestuariivivens]MBC8755204.1 hypothetical protein [Kordia aestuariivivens]